MSFKSEQSVDNYISFGAKHLFQSYTSPSELCLISCDEKQSVADCSKLQIGALLLSFSVGD